MKRFFVGGLFALHLAVCPVRAQQQDQPPSVAAEPVPGVDRMGAHLYNVSIFGDYFSNGVPPNFASPTSNLQSDVAYGGSLSMGWIKTGSRVDASVQYTPTYSGRMRYSNLHTLGHDLNMNVGFQVRPKWTLRLGATGAIRDLQRVLFSPTQAAQIASAPATFNGLASGLVSGQYVNNQLASILTAPAVVNPAAGNILYGDRYLTTALNMGITYARSERLQISAGVTGSRSQGLSQNIGTAVPNTVLPRSTTGGAQASVSYGLTARLTLSGNWDGQRSFQYRQNGITYGGTLIHNTGGSLGYIAGTKWVFTVGGGIGFIPPALRTSATGAGQNTPGGARYLAHGTVAYKFFSQTLTATGSRIVSNAYGLGGGAVVTGDFAWHWNRPGSSWATSVDGGYQSFEVQGGSPLGGWRGMASLGRMLSRRLSCGANYSVQRNTGIYTGVNYALTRSGLQVMLSWSFADQQRPTP